MPTYRYYTIPISSFAPVGVAAELELSGVSLDKQINGPGNFQGTYRMNSDSDILNSVVLGATVPGWHALIVKRNDVPIWGGPIWSRSYESEGQTISITAQTFESVFQHAIITSDFVKAAVNQTTIVDDIVTLVQSTGSGIDCSLLTAHQTILGVPTRTMAIAATEARMAEEVLNQLTDGDDGLIYTINLTGTNDTPTKTLQTYYNGSAAPSSGLALDYPGTLSQFWFTENGAKGGVRHVATAGGTAAITTLSNTAAQPTGSFYPTTNWPKWGESQSYLDVTDLTTLQAKADRQAILFKTPVAEPVFELTDVAAEVFTNWNDLGKTAIFNVQDVRFPSGITFLTQLAGWSLTPESSDGPEKIRLQSMSDQ
jgi:hypothetical protein